MHQHFTAFLESIAPVTEPGLVTSVKAQFEYIFEGPQEPDPMAQAPVSPVTPPPAAEVPAPMPNPAPEANPTPTQLPPATSPAVAPAAGTDQPPAPTEAPVELKEISEVSVIKQMTGALADEYDVMSANPESRDAFWEHLRTDAAANEVASGKMNDAEKKWLKELIGYFAKPLEEPQPLDAAAPDQPAPVA